MEIQTLLKQDILTKAFQELYPNKEVPKLNLEYSNRFSDYNGNVKFEKLGRLILSLTFSLSKKFKDCEDEIKIGIIQELMNKVYKTKIQTFNQDLYKKFTKHLGNYAIKGESNKFLKELFEEINLEYFSGLMEQPTMIFGQKSYRSLGHYNYNKDLVTISSIFLDENNEIKDINLVKYVLYHELLHKKHKFKVVNNQNRHHTGEFKKDEKKYQDKNIEFKLKSFLGRQRIKKEINKFGFNKLKEKLKKFF
ncbi:MAG: SprT-like domain-containing protein [Candidatus Woesearchaeota archaeon]